MAALTVVLTAADGSPVDGVQLTALEWSRDGDAPCDALHLQYRCDRTLPEIDRVALLYDGKTVFNGFCDLQRESVGKTGRQTYLYARSGASLLVDSEALPGTFNNATAHTLFLLYAKPLGFQCALPRCVCSGEYVVNKGSSQYGAVNEFVYALTGKNICVSPDNVLYLPDGAGTVTLSADRILNEQRRISRGAVLSRIDFKTQGDDGYHHHLLSRCFDEKGITRTRKVNLSALPYWQQNAAVQGKMQKAADGYLQTELTVDGCLVAELYDTVHYPSHCAGTMRDERLCAFTVRLDSSGIQTKLRLNSRIDIKEITYVAE